MSVFIKRSEMYYREQSLDFTASVTEEGTGVCAVTDMKTK